MKQKDISNIDKPKNRDELFGLEKAESLQSTNFATPENSYLNEHYQADEEE